MLRTLLKVDAVSARTKDRLQIVLSATEALERQKVRFPAKATNAIREVFDQVDSTKSVAEMIRGLKKAIGEKRYADIEGMDQALSLAVAVLTDGSSTIYSPAYYRSTFPKQGADDRVTVMSFEIGKADVEGIVEGGVGGCMIGAMGGTVTVPGGATVVGCAAVGTIGAVVSGTGSSVGKAVGELLDWLF